MIQNNIEQSKENHLQWMEQRVGYGRLDAPYWFVGMEEAGRADEISTRMAAPFVEDLYDAHWGAFGGRYDNLFHPRNASLQRTWAKLIRALLVAKGEAPTLHEIKRYQALRWGRVDGETLLTELYPVASPQLSTDTYKRTLLPSRVRLLRGLFRKHKPHFVIAYGTTYADQFKRVFSDPGTTWRRFADEPEAGEYFRNIAIVPHPTAFHQTNARFDLIGRWARQLATN